ncbi:MAG: nickel-dependent lactate racemase, partial [Bacillota bacterium]|nr:nickel-dependent lactate racemase [Bacillota bacterium]
EQNPIGETSTDNIVSSALLSPIGSPRLKDIVMPDEKIAILTSDITRPMPTSEVIPHVLDELYIAGVHKEDVTLVFATGSHRSHTEDERRKLAGDRAFEEIKCVDSDPEDCIHLGFTKNGTPVDITRVVAEADRCICLGNIEFHYFAGYSGGVKALFPGASTPKAIQTNHSMMIDEKACTGNLDGNPVRDDLEEVLKYYKVDFIVNVVLDEHKRIIHAVAGDVIEAHREGCKFLDKLYKVEIPEKADLVIVSQGGAPKDLNLYQTQKALDNSKHAVKPGGKIILLGSCKEGLGQSVFEEWILSAKRPRDLIDRVKSNFRLGGHKAAAIAMVLERAEIKLISDLSPELVKSIFMTPYESLQIAVDEALAELREEGIDNPSIIVMPYGGSTLPVIK